MPSTATIILEYVCPILGTIAANVMFAAPFKDVQKALARGSLGDLNPLPWVFMLGNTFGWLTYSILVNNLYVFFANAPGFLLATWFNLAASKLLFQQQFQRIPSSDELTTPVKVSGTDDSSTTISGTGEASELQSTTTAPPPLKVPRHDYLVLACSTFWMIIIAILGFAKSLSPETRQFVVGSVTNLNLVFFYGAPLSTIWAVLRTRNTATIHVPTMLTNTCSALFWAAYGCAVLDFFIAVPNGLGSLLGGIQLALYFIFPRGGETAPPVVDAKDKENVLVKALASSKTALMVDVSESPLALPFESSSDPSELTEAIPMTERDLVGANPDVTNDIEMQA